ncbi:MAG TPA: hypothetical protein VKR58_03785, partial [Aquella sp.]|nr:hypothetical protein [Aquella sp.]
MNEYILLISIPLGVLLLITGVFKIFGLPWHSSLGFGLFLSAISIMAIHRYNFNGDLLQPDPGNLYTSIYVIVSILILIIIIIYNLIVNRTRRCCCRRKDNPNLYEDPEKE